MRVTQQTDYAIRICCVLDEAGERLDAAELSKRAGVPQSFALKTLRLLSHAGVVRSYTGNRGGYELARDASVLSVAELIEIFEGPIYLSKCMDCEYECTRNPRKTNCKMHVAFCTLSRAVEEHLRKITVRTLTDPSLTTRDVAEMIKNKK
jgi:Rrf2 family protein